MNKKLLTLTTSLIIVLSGCTSLTSLNPDLEYDKTVSLICTGHYQVLNNGTVTNNISEAFKIGDHHKEKEDISQLHEVAQDNFLGHIRCLDIAKRYVKKYDITSDKLDNNAAYELRAIFLNNLPLIVEDLKETKPRKEEEQLHSI